MINKRKVNKTINQLLRKFKKIKNPIFKNKWILKIINLIKQIQNILNQIYQNYMTNMRI